MKGSFLYVIISISSLNTSAQGSSENLIDIVHAVRDSIEEKESDWLSMQKFTYRLNNNELLTISREKLYSFVDKQHDEIATLANIWPGMQQYTRAVIDFLRFEKRFINEALKPFENLTRSSSEQDITVSWERLEEMTEKFHECDKCDPTLNASGQNCIHRGCIS